MTKLTENDAALYRLYAVGLLTYEEALKQAESEFHLRRALLQFDQVARADFAIPPAPESKSAHRSAR